MPLKWRCRGAYRKVAPLAFLAMLAGPAVAAPLCPADRVDEQVRVTHVYDGDTVKLSDGRKVRLIGIDAPEIGHRGEPSQPLAEEARHALESLLRSARRIGLRYDTERRDQYGRLLAHLYLGDGSAVAAELLDAGLASALAVPPNLWNQPCFLARERTAWEDRRGIWTLRPYSGVESRELEPGTGGFHRVFGRVARVGQGKKSIWLNLEGGLAVRIPRDDLGQFDGVDLQRLRGRRIMVRGRIYADGSRLQMTIQHPSALEVQP
jgi:endonuclease YncB( thermonuclease family)